MKTQPKVVVFGLDGTTFYNLDPLMEKGVLPTLKKISDSGCKTVLRSSVPPITVPSWASFATGCTAGKHGIYEFLIKKPGSYEETPINRTFLGAPTLWHRLSEAGKKVLVLNVPTTYPPEPVKGALVSGFLTLKDRGDFVYPPELLSELEQKFGPYYLYMKTRITGTYLQDEHITALIQDCRDMLDYKMAIARYLYDKIEPDFTMIHIWGTDRIQHELWHLIDSNHPAYDAELAARHGQAIENYYRRVDDHLNDFMKLAGDNVDYFIISDHGFGPIHTLIDLNYWLYQQGYLHFKKDFNTLLKVWLWERGITWEKLLFALLKIMNTLKIKLKPGVPYEELTMFHMGKKRFLLTAADIDLTRTRVYAKTGMGQLIINLEGREPTGCVAPGQEYEQLRADIIAQLQALSDPRTAHNVQADIHTREIYQGPFRENCPDITYLAQKDGYFAVNLTGFTSNKVFVPLQGMYGNHTMEGVLMAAGPHIVQTADSFPAGIIDLAPTALYLLEQPIPSFMDGAPLKDIVKPDFLQAHPPRFVDEELSPPKTQAGMDDEASDEIRERLKSLGYLG
ncbi:alkaline phosphatase family protein [candidate division CSSED10-310 bacterium]|uniref:Alkaline phosphatase family protein n=1 Tax=candidate division CSSED10-310 bacterium TaxID=2855610 RepID=A0ABV6YX25_UNCC1